MASGTPDDIRAADVSTTLAIRRDRDDRIRSPIPGSGGFAVRPSRIAHGAGALDRAKHREPSIPVPLQKLFMFRLGHPASSTNAAQRR